MSAANQKNVWLYLRILIASNHSQGRLYFALVPPTPAPVMEPHAQAPRLEVDEERLWRIFVDFPRRRRGTRT